MHTFDLQKNEKIIRVMHQHKMVLFKPTALALLLLVVPWYYLLKFSLTDYYALSLFTNSIGILYFLRELKLWKLHEYVITTTRLIKQHHETIFKKVVVETPLERILNVSFKTTGIFSAMFKFGNVEVQVVGLIEPIVLEHIKHPERIKEYLWRTHEQSVKGNGQSDIEHIQERIGYTKENQRVL